MSGLHERLVERYADHYSRVNMGIESREMGTQLLKVMEAGYGDMVDPLPQGSEVLDLGCGTGLLLYWLTRRSNINAVGVDASPAQVEIAQRNLPTATIVCEDGLSFLEANPGRFAGIFCMDVLEHVPDDDLCLRWVEASRNALKPGGFFHCRVPNAANFSGTYSRYMDLTHKRSFTSTSLIQLLEAADMVNIELPPSRAVSFKGAARLRLEYALHRAIFIICGRPLERVFTQNVSATGYRQGES